MKLKQIKQILEVELPKLNIPIETPSGGTQTVYKNANQLRDAVNSISKTGLLKQEITELQNTLIFTSGQSNVRIVNNEAGKVTAMIEKLKSLVLALLQSLKEVSPKDHPESVSIKLPNVSDFDDLSKAASDFHKVISQAIVNDEIGGQVEIKNVENGSIWLDVFLGTSAAVSLIGGLTWSAAVVFKKKQEGRILEQQVKALEIKNDSLKEIQEKQKTMLDKVVELEANHLYSENFQSENPEQIERLKHSIKLLSELLDKGAEIHPALQAPEKVSNLYPDFEKLGTITSKVKQIADGS